MKKELLVSWSVGAGGRHNGGKMINPQFSDIEKVLLDSWECSGTVTVHIVDGPDIGPQSLQVRIDKGMAILSLGVDTEDDHIVRTFSGNDIKGEVAILGDNWPLISVCRDYNLIYGVFLEFYNTGDVSTDLLN